MAEIQFNVNMDLVDKYVPAEDITIPQEDNLSVKFTYSIFNREVAEDLTGATNIVVSYVKPDGHIVLQSNGTLELPNKVNIVANAQAFTYVGKVYMQVQYKKGTQTFNTRQAFFWVEKSGTSCTTVASSDFAPYLDNVIATGEMLNGIDLQALIDSKQTAENAQADVDALTPRVTTLETDVSYLQARVTAVETKNTQQDTRLTSLENQQGTFATSISNLQTSDTAQNTRLTNLESGQTTQDNRLAAIETKNTTQDSRLTSLETTTGDIPTMKSDITAIKGVNTTQDNRLSALETAKTANDTKNTTQDTNIGNNATAISALQTSQTAQDTKITNLEAYQTSSNTRITAVETKNTTQDSRLLALEQAQPDLTPINNRLTAVETKNTAQDTRLTDLETAKAANDTKNTQQDSRLTSLENGASSLATTVANNKTAQDTVNASTNSSLISLTTRVTATETKNTQQDTRLDSVEAKNTSQDTKIATLEGANSVIIADIDALESSVGGHETRLNQNDTKNASQDSLIASNSSAISSLTTNQTNTDNRVTSLETAKSANDVKNTQQDSRLTAVETDNTNQGAAILVNTSDISALKTEQITQNNLIGVNQTNISNLTIRTTAQSFDLEAKIPTQYDDSKILSYLEGGPKKVYTTSTATSTGITKVNNGTRVIRISPSLSSYIYSDKHLKFTDGYPLVNTASITHEIATVNTGNHIDGSTVAVNDQFSILLKGIRPQFASTDAYGVNFLANIYNANAELRLRLDDSQNGLNMEVRKGGSAVGTVYVPFAFAMNDNINILLTQKDKLEITACVNNDKNKIYTNSINQVIPRGDYTLIPLDYQTSSANLQASSSYDSILVFSKKFDENKAIVTENNYYNYGITGRQQILSGTGNPADWNEKMAGETSNILHDPLDTERPYKIAVGGHNGAYTETLIGKTGFAYSKDLVTWTYVNNGNYCIDQYTEDGCIVKFRGKYHYYAENMPNRNVVLYTSFDFVNWTYEGIVASPDLDPSLANRPSSEVCAGSPSAIVKDGVLYLFIEYGYTSNTGHSNRVLTSVDGINFRKLSTVPDIFKREFCRPILDPTVWTINNLEGINEVDGVYYAWLSITNKTGTPTVFSMWEVTSEDLITWKFTGATFNSNAGDFITFACLSDSSQVITNGKYTGVNATELLFLSREKQDLPDEFKKATVNLINDPYFTDIKTTVVNNVWFYTKSLLTTVSEGRLTYYKPEVNQGIVQYITGIKPNTLYKLTIKSNGRFVMNGYQGTTSNKVETDFIQYINEVDGSVIFKTGSTTDILSCAWTGFLDSPPILGLSNLVLEEI
ncbi:hypothetical protein [Bacillus cereus]|uniref:hypothetical protein n=1 Tax=Bacillus cereus TaxID=1396 RepID=UPI001643527B|nr:hypothetical protein [Bacillus cereus]